MPSFRDGPQRQTRNLETVAFASQIPDSGCIAARCPGMTTVLLPILQGCIAMPEPPLDLHADALTPRNIPDRPSSPVPIPGDIACRQLQVTSVRRPLSEPRARPSLSSSLP